jgi:hypothetical protein
MKSLKKWSPVKSLLHLPFLVSLQGDFIFQILPGSVVNSIYLFIYIVLKSTFASKRYATTVIDFSPPEHILPFHTFIAMRKLVLNYARSSRWHPSHKMLPHCTLNTVLWNNSSKSVCNMPLNVFNTYRDFYAIKRSSWGSRWEKSIQLWRSPACLHAWLQLKQLSICTCYTAYTAELSHWNIISTGIYNGLRS